MAFLLRNSVFVHVPKTGGQWVSAALENAGLLAGTLGVVHASPDDLRDRIEFQQRTYVFAFVRHPLTWYQSMWAHRMDEGWDEPIDDPQWFTPRWIEKWAEFTDAARATTFAGFLRGIADRYPDGFLSELFPAYTEACSHVGRFESLEADLLRILTTCEPGFEPSPILATKPRNVRGGTPRRRRDAVYTPELTKLVLAAEREILHRFGYGKLAA